MKYTLELAHKARPTLVNELLEVWMYIANKEDETKADEIILAARKAEALTESASFLVEAGKMISSANMKTLQSAMQAMKTAMESIMPLLGADADETVTEVSNALLDTEIDPVMRVAASRQNKKWETIKFGEAAKILAQSDSYDSIRQQVSSALRKKAISDSLKSKINSDAMLGYDDYYDYGCMPYIRDLYSDAVVYSTGGELYQCDYSIKNDVVTLGVATPVKVSYVPTSESSSSSVEAKVVEVEIRGDLIQLDISEKAVKSDGTARIKLISPGWGSSGYYSKEMLKRDGPSVFKKGTQMYMNHPTEAESRDRPERNVLDLAGVIDSDVVWEDATSNNTGPGLYANAKVFGNYKEFIDEAAPHIGVSIRAGGTAVEGEAENRHGYVINSLTEGYSVDYVTMAGRGGEVLSLYESARNKNKNLPITEASNKQEKENTEVFDVEITPEQLKQFTEAANKIESLQTQLIESNKKNETLESQVARMQEAMVVGEARNVVIQTLATINLPDITRNRLVDECSRTIPLRDDKSLDKEKLVEAVKAKAIDEMKYLESVTGSVTGGKVVGMSQPVTAEIKESDVDAELGKAVAGLGFSEAATKIVVQGRFN